MDNNETRITEKPDQIAEDKLDTVAGGGDITYIICHICGFELPIHGPHNFVNKCPRCGSPMKTW